MKASDLPDAVKRQLAKEIEQQVGSATYHKMVDQIGEDKVLDFAIESAQKSAQSRSSSEGKKEEGWGDILMTIGGWLAVAFCYGMGSSNESYYGIGAVIMLLLLFKGTGFLAKCITVARKSAWLLIPYGLGLALIGGTNRLVYHVFAIPLGLLWMWLMSR